MAEPRSGSPSIVKTTLTGKDDTMEETPPDKAVPSSSSTSSFSSLFPKEGGEIKGQTAAAAAATTKGVSRDGFGESNPAADAAAGEAMKSADADTPEKTDGAGKIVANAEKSGGAGNRPDRRQTDRGGGGAGKRCGGGAQAGGEALVLGMTCFSKSNISCRVWRS